MKSAVSLARELTETGMERKAADAIADAIVTHVGKSRATKADIARLGEKLDGCFDGLDVCFDRMKTQMNILIVLTAGLYVPLAVVLFGGGG